jgi:hypothetical protein
METADKTAQTTRHPSRSVNISPEVSTLLKRASVLPDPVLVNNVLKPFSAGIASVIYALVTPPQIRYPVMRDALALKHDFIKVGQDMQKSLAKFQKWPAPDLPRQERLFQTEQVKRSK